MNDDYFNKLSAAEIKNVIDGVGVAGAVLMMANSCKDRAVHERGLDWMTDSRTVYPKMWDDYEKVLRKTYEELKKIEDTV